MSDASGSEIALPEVAGFDEAEILQQKRRFRDSLNLVAAVYRDDDYYVIDVTPCSDGPLYRVSKEHTDIEPHTTVDCHGETIQLYRVSIQRDVEVLKQELSTLETFFGSGDSAGPGGDLTRQGNVTRASSHATGLSLASGYYPKRVQVYAGPNVWGPWRIVDEHTGSSRRTLTVSPLGDTMVYGEVSYWSRWNSHYPTVESFTKEVTITTGNYYANIQVRLKGVPLGSSCYVDVSLPGGGSDACLFTYSLVDMRMFADDSPELSTLRRFREYLSSSEYGKTLVQEYESSSALLIEALKNHPDRDNVIRNVAAPTIMEMIQSVNKGDYQNAINRWRKLRSQLESSLQTF